MNAIGIGNYGMITGNYTRRTDIEQKQTSTSFADVVQNKLDDADKARSVSESHSQSCTGKPVWHWHDGQFGYSAEVYRNEGSTSEYTVKLKYDNGKEEERIVDAEKVNASSCNMVDLSVRLYHLEAEGKIENPAPEIILAHIYLQHRMPNANENTIVDYRSWYEQQLDLELQNAKSLELMASQGERKVASVDRSTSFSKIFGDTQLKCPYSHLAKDGLIEYNGVVFVCDYKRNSICLGDVSDSKNVLNISLPSGGNLKVNVDNLGDLSKAAGMFTPADLNAIMRAIAQYNHCTKKLNELDEEEIETVENVTDKADEQQEIHEAEAAYNEEDVNTVFTTMTLFRINMAIENRAVVERS